jgi:hypothetical protein
MQQLNIKIITVNSKIQPPQSNQKLISIQLYFNFQAIFNNKAENHFILFYDDSATYN